MSTDHSSKEKQTYLRVKPFEGGSWCLMTPAELVDMIDDGDQYIVKVVRLSADEYEKLPEFEGW